MKNKKMIWILSLLLTAVLFSGCGMRQVEQRLDAVEDALEQKADAVENKIEQSLTPAEPEKRPQEKKDVSAADAHEPALSAAEAEQIALEHAGLKAEEVKGLHSYLDWDDGRKQYEVEFFHDFWEYDYEIHADTGDILSFDKDK